MTKRSSANPEATGGSLKEALAVLISSTRSKKRPLPLTEIAKWLEIAVAKLGSYETVAQRIGLSPHMLRQFSNVRRLPESVQQLFESRQIDSVDASTHLAMLPEKEQNILAAALTSGEIDTKDLRAIVQLHQREKSSSIDDLLRRVKESKTRHEYVAEFVVRGARSRAVLLSAFETYIPPQEIVRLELNGAFGRLVLTQKGKQALSKTARALRVPIKNVIPNLLRDRQHS